MSRKQSSNGRSEAPATAPEAESRPWVGNLLLFPVMLTAAFAFTDQPVALAIVPGILSLVAVIERSRTLKEALFWTGLFGATGIGIGYYWLAQTVQDFGGIPPLVSYLILAVFGIEGHKLFAQQIRQCMDGRFTAGWTFVDCIAIGD